MSDYKDREEGNTASRAWDRLKWLAEKFTLNKENKPAKTEARKASEAESRRELNNFYLKQLSGYTDNPVRHDDKIDIWKKNEPAKDKPKNKNT